MAHHMNFYRGARVICSVNVPNPRYRGHRGEVLHVLRDEESHEILLHVRWDEGDEPIGDRLQLMTCTHVEVDRDWHQAEHLILEEPV
jgi:hypothetical protein